MKKIGDILLKIRNDKNLSQRDVADYLGIHQSTYNNWENNKSIFKVEYLPKLAALFQIDATELIPEGTMVKIVHNHENTGNSVNGFEIKVDAREMYQEIIAGKNALIAAKEETIASQHSEINSLKAELGRLRG